MPIYVWHYQEQKGEISAKNIFLARALLRRQGIIADKIQRKPRSWFTKKRAKFSSTLFFEKLALLCEAKLPLITALKFLEQAQAHPMLTEIIQALHAGKTFTQALAAYPHDFQTMDLACLGIAEKTGKLLPILQALRQWHAQAQQAQQKLRRILLYPSLVLLAAILLVIFLIFSILPQFSNLYAEFNAPLPLITKTLLNMTAFFQKYAWAGFLACASFGVLARKRLKIGLSHLPGIRRLLQETAQGRCFLMLALALKAGLTLDAALTLLLAETPSPELSRPLSIVRDHLQKGWPIGQAFRASPLFSEWTLQWIEVGASSAELATVFEKLAEHYEARLEQKRAYFSALLEPLIMSILGLVIGGVVLAMYLPLLNMGSLL